MADDEPDEPIEAPLGLRERRRQATRDEISDAALDLFERHGVAGTTVDDIAHAAGVSPRTFFRYFPTKEHAVFVDDEQAELVMSETLAAVRAGAPVSTALETGWLRLLDDFAREDGARDRVLRTRRLIAAEPSLLAIALQRDEEHIGILTAAAVAATGDESDALTARALVAIVATTFRLAFDEWARRAEADVAADVREIYFELRRGVSAYAAELLG
ncbi:TetR family transcriptional regulator [Agromyces aerolatus]|uniref:TetR family transcriptional regulator n=1 Tax=Agromyces sp. LY-1074 TaxID=3074080 RepID=UPI002860C0E2|nr:MULTISPECIES: TetR family transcriptional regulator [unclassified Agromyces]MDR5700340.1 TetR family transcriptional regulator [Agromyces sp. LY-1074]MDR5706682.1 TetR family transcriptional regulator [Agromyces sp. LY-1358]